MTGPRTDKQIADQLKRDAERVIDEIDNVLHLINITYNKKATRGTVAANEVLRDKLCEIAAWLTGDHVTDIRKRI